MTGFISPPSEPEGDPQTGFISPPSEPKGEPKSTYGEEVGLRPRRVIRYFLEHYAFVFSLLYGYATVLGIVHSFWLYSRFQINIFDYAEISDFLLAALRAPAAILGGAFLVFSIGLLAFILNTFTYIKLRRSSLPQVPRGVERIEEIRPLLESRARIHGAREALVAHYNKGLRQHRLTNTIVGIINILVAIFMIYLSVYETAQSIKAGTEPKVEVRYRSSSSGSADQVTEQGLEIIGATQKVVFFYDVNDKNDWNDNHTLVIPQTQIVSIKVPDKIPD